MCPEKHVLVKDIHKWAKYWFLLRAWMEKTVHKIETPQLFSKKSYKRRDQ